MAIRNQQNRRETCHLLWAAEAREEPELDVIEFYGLVTQKLQDLKINPDFLNRNVNEGWQQLV